MKRTKKILAILSVVALLATCAVNAIAVEISDNPRPTKAFVDLTTKAAFDKAVAGGNVAASGGKTTISYDEEQQALNVTGTQWNGGNNCQVGFVFDNKHEALENANGDRRVVAALMKVSGPTTSVPQWTNAYLANVAGGSAFLSTPTAYQNTTDWQIMVYEAPETWTAEDASLPIEWTGVTMALHSGAWRNYETFLIKWVGVFDYVEEAYAYAGMQMPAEEEETAVKTDPSASFAKATGTGFTGVSFPSASYYNGFSTREYDATMDAYKVAPLQASSGDYGTLQMTFNGKQNCAGYKTVAALVKFKSAAAADAVSPAFYLGTSASASSWASSLYPTVQATTDWQLLVMTQGTHSAFADDKNWDRLRINMMASGDFTGLSADDCTYWVKWAGVFASEADAYYYADMIVPESALASQAFSNGYYDYTSGNTSTFTPLDAKTSFAHSSADQAMLISSANLAQTQLGIGGYWASAGTAPNINSNAVIAAYVKVTDPHATEYQFAISTATSGTSFYTQAPVSYVSGGDWQLVYWDFKSDATNGVTSGAVRRARFYATQSLTPDSTDDGVLVKWLGIFPSVAAAQADVKIADYKAHNAALTAKQEAAAANQAAITPVINAINNLPAAISPAPATLAAIQAVRAQYGELTTEQKLMISNNPALRAAEDQYAAYYPVQSAGASLRSDPAYGYCGLRFGANLTQQNDADLDGWDLTGVGFVFCLKDKWEAVDNGNPLLRGASYAVTLEKNIDALDEGEYKNFYASIVEITEEADKDIKLMGRSYLIYTKDGEETLYLYNDNDFNANGSYASIRSLNQAIELANQ